MPISNLQFPSTVTQCGEATLSWEATPGSYPARLELYYQDGLGPWHTVGDTFNIDEPSHTFTINVPAGLTVWPTITGHDGYYNQVQVGSLVQPSGNDACLPTSGTQTLTVTDVSTAVQTQTETVVTTGLSTVTVSADSDNVEVPKTVTVTETLDGAEDDADFTADSSWAIENTSSLDAAPTGGMRPEVGASFADLQAANSSYRSATYALAALFAAACAGILFLLFVLRRTRRRRQAPLRPRIARFTDGSFMSEHSTTPSYDGGPASSNPFAGPAVVPAPAPPITRSPTLRNSLGFGVDRRNSNTGPQPPVSSLFLQVPQNNRGDNNSISDNELSRMGTIESVDERRTTGMQNLYVRNHSQFTLNSFNSDTNNQSSPH